MYSAAEIRRKKRKLFEDVFVGKQYQYESYGFIKIVGTYFNFISTDNFCNHTGYHLRFKALFKDGKSIKFIVHITTELYKKFIKENNIDISHAISIGDQVMTDVLMANRLKISVILLDPLTVKDEPITFIPRLLDKHFRKKINKLNLTKEI